CEMPLDLTLARARACEAAVARAGVVCMIGVQRRFDPTFEALKRRIDAGEIGTPELLVVTSRDPGAPAVDVIKHSGGSFKVR
ncbi:inositol 2-dehydrogenase, partial [Burkholderia pseudomallei]